MSETSVYHAGTKKVSGGNSVNKTRKYRKHSQQRKSRRKQQICLATTMLANAYTIVVGEVETKQS